MQESRSIVAVDRFIQATRDSGYKNTVSAVAELVDNSLQAKATRIHITITQPENSAGKFGPEIFVLDNGRGMNRSELQEALRFGGSSRFNDRTGLGRYGMGLPNASLSQARRLNVWTWQKGAKAITATLDHDQIASGEQTSVSVSRPSTLKYDHSGRVGTSGTLIHWECCDRLDYKRISTNKRTFAAALGRIFRHFLWAGVKIFVNDELIQPVDPLFIEMNSGSARAKPFGESFSLEVRSDFENGQASKTGLVTVTFSELPVRQWQSLSNSDKKKLGITNGAGASVVRNGREIEFGWFFMGKRKENYDDWWRCEIKFDPVLDDIFGITHTKQGIRPHPELKEILISHLNPIANALNKRIQDKHRVEKLKAQTNPGIVVAERLEHTLKPIPTRSGRITEREKRALSIVTETLGSPTNSSDSIEYKIIDGDPSDKAFMAPVFENNRVVVLINRQHRFFKAVYQPLMTDSLSAEDCKNIIMKLLLAAGRAELQATQTPSKKELEHFRDNWSANLSAYL
jgi:hypothetical protein